MTEPTAEPTTLQLAIDATCFVTPPGRHQFISDTLTRLWDHQFVEWYQYLLNLGNFIHITSDGRLWFNLLLGGFANGSNTGILGLALYADGQPLSRFIPCLYGDFSDGLANAERVSVTVAEVAEDGTLSKATGASLDPVDRLTFGQLAEIARRAVALLDRAGGPNPKPPRRSWWARFWGRN